MIAYAYSLKPFGFLIPTTLAAGILSYLITPRIVSREAPFADDIATRLGAPAYVAARRATLDRASESMLTTPGAETRTGVRPFRLLSQLEEDE